MGTKWYYVCMGYLKNIAFIGRQGLQLASYSFFKMHEEHEAVLTLMLTPFSGARVKGLIINNVGIQNFVLGYLKSEMVSWSEELKHCYESSLEKVSSITMSLFDVPLII